MRNRAQGVLLWLERTPAAAWLRARLEPIAHLRAKLIIPYVLLTLITALIGVFIITRLVASSIEERYANQLLEASRVAADDIVRFEGAHLEDLRLLAFMEGVPEAVRSGDRDLLLTFFEALAINNKIEMVSAIAPQGMEIVTLTLDLESGDAVHYFGADFSAIEPVARVLSGDRDELGDKYSGFLETNQGRYLISTAPVRDDEDNLLGVLIVGTRLDTLLDDIKLQALADVAVFSGDGELWATTLPESDEGFGPLLYEDDPAAGSLKTFTRNFKLYGRRYGALYAPLAVRHKPVGEMSVILPSDYIVTTMATSRNSFSAIFALGTLAVFVLGYLLAQNIARPILRLRSISKAVAAGDLEQSSGLSRADEIGELASAFDIMTERLRERTQEAARLYAEAIQRNRELAEINERLQNAQAQLIQSEKLAAVGQLTAGIVHDVKNPLAVIKGLAEELEEELEADGFAKEGLETIRQSASRANTIVSDLLKFARQSKPTMSRRDLRETVRSVVRLTEYLVRKGKIEVHLDLPEEAVSVVYDAQQLEQVLINLITNAVQAMPDGGTLDMEMAVEGAEVLLRVHDSGIGIPEENLGRIFDPFFTTKPEGEGTGLGLSVSYGIISRHGGRIEVESEPGVGTTFTIFLPKEHEEERANEEEGQHAARAGR